MHHYAKHPLLTAIFNRILTLAGKLQNLPNTITPPPFRLMQISSAFWQSRSLYTAAQLDIAGHIKNSTLSITELSVLTGTDEESLYRLLRMLTAMGIFVECHPRHFSNNKLSRPLMDDDPQTIRSMILMHNSAEMSHPWYESLQLGIEQGKAPFKISHGAELFDYMDNHPKLDTLFSQAMDTVDALLGDSYATDFDWSHFRRLIDVGGSLGAKAATILQHHPDLEALVFDRPSVIEGALDKVSGKYPAEVLERIQFEGGDMFEAMPKAQDNKDCYLFIAVFHSLSDPQAIELLRQVHKADGGVGAKLAIMEMVVPEQSADMAYASFDMQMLVNTSGKERTLAQWESLFAHSSYRLQEAIPIRGYGSILLLQADE